MKPKLLIIMGKSGSGKTSMRLILEEHGFIPLPDCTNRQKRPGEIDGRDYHFLTTEQMNSSKIICKKTYNTTLGEVLFGLIKIELEKGENYVVIAHPYNYQELLDTYCDVADIISIYITTHTENRLLNLIKREEEKDIPDYKEICRRFSADAYDFSKKNRYMPRRDEFITIYNSYEEPIEHIANEMIDWIRRGEKR